MLFLEVNYISISSDDSDNEEPVKKPSGDNEEIRVKEEIKTEFPEPKGKQIGI